MKFHGQYGIVDQAERWVVVPRSKKIRLIAEDRFLEFTPKTTYLKSFDNSIIYFSENKLELQGTHLLEHLPSGTIWEIGMNGVIGDRKILPDMVEKIYPKPKDCAGLKKMVSTASSTRRAGYALPTDMMPFVHSANNWLQ